MRNAPLYIDHTPPCQRGSFQDVEFLTGGPYAHTHVTSSGQGRVPYDKRLLAAPCEDRYWSRCTDQQRHFVARSDSKPADQDNG